MVLFSIPLLPKHVELVLVTISQIVNFELIPSEEILTWAFGFNESNSLNQVFENAKFDGSIFIMLLGTVFLLQCVFIL